MILIGNGGGESLGCEVGGPFGGLYESGRPYSWLDSWGGAWK